MNSNSKTKFEFDIQKPKILEIQIFQESWSITIYESLQRNAKRAEITILQKSCAVETNLLKYLTKPMGQDIQKCKTIKRTYIKRY